MPKNCGEVDETRFFNQTYDTEKLNPKKLALKSKFDSCFDEGHFGTTVFFREISFTF